MGSPLVRTFSYHNRQKYGHVVGKIPVDLGVPCPNRKKGGCIFCRPASFTPSYLQSLDDVSLQIKKGKIGLLRGRFVYYFAYFQQESCTVLPAEVLLEVMHSLLADRECLGLIISTRPDYVDREFLIDLAGLVVKSGKECLWELGLQTVHDKSLRLLNRNHTMGDFKEAAARIREFACFQLGAHLIFGIPGESEDMMLHSVRTVCDIGVDALKLHHLQVIRDTPLHRLYEQGRVPLFSRDDYLRFLLKVVVSIPAEVTLHRLWSTAHPHLLVAPKWGCLAHELSADFRGMMEKIGVWQGKMSANTVL